MSRNPPRRVWIAALAAALSLLLAVSALAAHPKAGKTYKGFTSTQRFNGFRAPVSFKVSSDGKRLLGFVWYGFGCMGAGGTGNPFTGTGYTYHKIGTIKVSAKGTFSIKNAKWTFHMQPPQHGVLVTFSTIDGRFKNAKTATGQIRFTQTLQGNTCHSSDHHNPTTTFTATTP
ncbi:MAG: hypothetical protein ACXVHJ_33240 [Solirubrobacteraceae bacterium]